MAGMLGKTAAFLYKRTYVPYCAAVVAAAGNSERMEMMDKLFIEFGGVPVLAYTLQALENCDLIREIVIATRGSAIEAVQALCRKYGITKAVKVLEGGETRMESVMIATMEVSAKAKLIAVHDGARPFVTREILESTIRAAVLHNAAAPGIAIADTVKSVEHGIIRKTLDRNAVVRIQTPQVFQADILKAALTNAKNKGMTVTDECMAAEAIGVQPYVTEGSAENIKLTVPEDIYMAKAILEKRRNAT